ncbi:MAG: hypothetical protein QME12_04095 [Nanoarchaeota archaeon]|nr:hypothetical protein [Nanoarchaeota archaeon]
MIIERPVEASRISRIKNWALVYGRRKTGKTFLIRNFVHYDDYFFVKRDKAIISEKTGDGMNYSAFRQIFVRLVKDKKTVVVDEFHRLGTDFMDYLHFIGGGGKVILISSTFHLAKELISPKSPLLGLFAEFPLGLISIRDVMAKISAGKKEMLELAVLMQEPLVIPYYKKGIKPQELFLEVMSASKYAVPALIGEIFTEEERSLSSVYEGVLRAIASGKQVSTEISSFLFSKGLIPKDNQGALQPYFNNLMHLGLIKRVKVENKKSFIYLLPSPLIQIYYYGDEKYNLSESASFGAFASAMFNEAIPRIIEAQVRSFLAEYYGLIEGVVLEKDYDIDCCLMKFGKVEIAAEIKWKGKLDKEDILKSETTLSRINAKRKLLFVPDKSKVAYSINGVEIVDIMDFMNKRKG